jgi:hypothetical protein
MRKTLFFLLTVAVGVVALAGLVRWVDPLGEYYDAGATAQAERSNCLLSQDVAGVASWWDVKRDLVRLRKPHTLVVGTSRVLEMRAPAGDPSFVNAGLPGESVPMLAAFFTDLHRIDPTPKTVYLGVDPFWLNANWLPPYSYTPPGRPHPVRKLLTRQQLTSALSTIARNPSVLFRHSHITHVDGMCVIDRTNQVAAGRANAWAPDGSLYYSTQLRPDLPHTPDDDFSSQLGHLDKPQYLGSYYGNWDRLNHLAELGQALALARSFGWKVVGFTPPYSTRYVRRLESLPQTAPRWGEYGTTMPALFKRYGFQWVETRWARDVGCSDKQFIDDGWHIDAACGTRLLRFLERASS